MPLNAYAYSSQITLGGNTVGIDVKTKGILIIGFYKIGNDFNKGELKQGDYITKVNGKEVANISELTAEIENSVPNDKVSINYRRNGHDKETNLKLIYEDNVYKTGLYVKDGITGIGTLTYIDKDKFAALGHEIVDSNTNSLVEIKSGLLFRNTITSIDKSISGTPGSKNAKFYYKTRYGNIYKNTKYGIFGDYTGGLNTNKLIDVASPSEVKIGPAKIYTVLKNEEIEEFNINITSINETSDIKNISFTIDDQALIEKTGGVVQGMSGSPIVQNNKIIGAVTHVIVENPITGYGLFITRMLEEEDK
jgi:stage IV sporulation protein B